MLLRETRQPVTTRDLWHARQNDKACIEQCGRASCAVEAGRRTLGAPEAGDMDAAEQEVAQPDCDCRASKSSVHLRRSAPVAFCNALSLAGKTPGADKDVNQDAKQLAMAGMKVTSKTCRSSHLETPHRCARLHTW